MIFVIYLNIVILSKLFFMTDGGENHQTSEMIPNRQQGSENEDHKFFHVVSI